MSREHDRTHNAVAIAWGLGWAVAVAVVLHSVPDRSVAGWVGVAAIVWGIPVALLARGRPGLRTILLAAAGARLVQIGATPTLSDDLYRYLFEGLALNAGHNPFLDSPSALSGLSPALAANVNHPDIPSIYPPFAQLWFRFLALFGTSAAIAQGFTAALDCLNVWLVYRICLDRERPVWPALVYALHPVPVLESAHGAHLETLGIATCLLVVLWFGRRPRLAALAAAVGVGVKLLPVLFIPSLVRTMRAKQAAAALGLGGLLLVLAALPVLSAGPALLDAFGTYSAHWSFNGLAFPALKLVLGDSARPVLAITGLGIAAHAATFRSPVAAWRQVGAGFLFLSPTVHPWYLLWALTPALLLGGRSWAVAACFLQSSYVILIAIGPGGVWHEPWWLGPVTWIPALVALGFMPSGTADPPPRSPAQTVP